MQWKKKCKKNKTKKTLGTVQAHLQHCALMHMLLHETGTKTRDRKLFYIGKIFCKVEN